MRPYYQLILFVVVAVLSVWFSRHHVFFWDTVQLGAKHAYWYYDNGLTPALLPDEIDSGHPPVFGWYLAACWAPAGGPGLPASHLAMLPFLLLLVWALYRLGNYWLGPAFAYYLLWLAAVDPTLAAQGILVSPDVVLISAFCLGLVGIVEKRSRLLAFGVTMLALISMRGMMVAVALYLFDVWMNERSLGARWWSRQSLFSLLRRSLPFLPGAVLAGGFMLWHWWEKGWIGYHPDSPWASAFGRVGAAGFLKNGALLAWRLLEFGRLAVIFVLGLGVVLWFKPHNRNIPFADQRKLMDILVLTALIALVLAPSFLLYKALHAQRYLLPLYLVLSLGALTFVFHVVQSVRIRHLLFTVMFAALLTGNRWVYPEGIAMGWDSTLAHLPYYGLRETMLNYIQKQGIQPGQVGTAFPEIGPFTYRDLSGQMEGFREKNLQTQTYILYSNVMNDFTDEERAALQSDWEAIHRLESRGVKFILYQKNNPQQ